VGIYTEDPIEHNRLKFNAHCCRLTETVEDTRGKGRSAGQTWQLPQQQTTHLDRNLHGNWTLSIISMAASSISSATSVSARCVRQYTTTYWVDLAGRKLIEAQHFPDVHGDAATSMWRDFHHGL